MDPQPRRAAEGRGGHVLDLHQVEEEACTGTRIPALAGIVAMHGWAGTKGLGARSPTPQYFQDCGRPTSPAKGTSSALHLLTRNEPAACHLPRGPEACSPQANLHCGSPGRDSSARRARPVRVYGQGIDAEVEQKEAPMLRYGDKRKRYATTAPQQPSSLPTPPHPRTPFQQWWLIYFNWTGHTYIAVAD
ncbi:hypothetical protein GWK47_012311 [Chionoecetes opilio]|uniref:Uncharacterized protein n=1 Tax=Chionoecetes opilio TaxID=41210 RepID=A0A8J4XXD6_CHIOP|nr:hypothetical protein GWK47_012311 [Chionoecetes opilio]